MRTLSLIAAALALTALPALAKGPECKWARSWEAALEEAKARNVPIMVTFHKDG